MPARWALLFLLAVALAAFGGSAWTHELRGVLGGALGIVVAIIGVFAGGNYEAGRQYVRGYEDGRAEERDDAGWGCRRV